MTDTKTLAELCEINDTKFILAMFVDLRGKPCAKLVPVEAVDELATDGVGFAGYAVGAIGQEPKDPDLMAIPDVSSFLPVPFIKEGLAIVHCDPYVLGKPWPFAPRNILKSLIAQTADAGFEPWVGAEVEYFLLKRDASGSLITADAADDSDRPCYDVRGLTRMYDHLTTVSTAMNQLGWSNYANDHEDGNGQFEQNFAYDKALVTADRDAGLRATAAAEGYRVLSKPVRPGALRALLARYPQLDLERIDDVIFGCVTQIGKGTGIPIVHTVELLDWATGGPKPAARACACAWTALTRPRCASLSAPRRAARSRRRC